MDRPRNIPMPLEDWQRLPEADRQWYLYTTLMAQLDQSYSMTAALMDQTHRSAGRIVTNLWILLFWLPLLIGILLFVLYLTGIIRIGLI